MAYYACYHFAGYQGALLGLALVPALVVIPAAIVLWRRGTIPLSALRPRWDNGLAGTAFQIYPDGADYLGDAAGGLRDDA
ncbi:WzxE protein [Raoultella ornithinolytica]|nr:WzxE protein [Raoultella ornithinolytica]